MKIKSIKANQTQVEFNDGTIVFVSYETPVAAFIPRQGIIRTCKQWSQTTTKHINQWIRDNFSDKVTVKKELQSILDGLL